MVTTRALSAMRLLVQAVVAGCVQALSLSIDNSSIRLEEFYHLSLCQPHGFSFRLDIQLSLAFLALVASKCKNYAI